MTSCICGTAQMNDTIVFKTGYNKVVEIDTFTTKTVYYQYHNKKLDEVKFLDAPTKKLKYFVMVDESGKVTYDSRLDYSNGEEKVKIDSLKVAEHDLSICPFLLPLASLNARYTYKFGNYMDFGINTRLTYISPILLDGGNIFMAGVGIRFMPYYSRLLCFGLDITPTFILTNEGQGALLPLSFDFDLYFGDKFGLAVDFGGGYVFAEQNSTFILRGHIGFLMRLGKRYNVPNQSNTVK